MVTVVVKSWGGTLDADFSTALGTALEAATNTASEVAVSIDLGTTVEEYLGITKGMSFMIALKDLFQAKTDLSSTRTLI